MPCTLFAILVAAVMTPQAVHAQTSPTAVPVAQLTCPDTTTAPIAAIDVEGLRRTRPKTLIERLRLFGAQETTRGALLKAGRRLSDLPSIGQSSISVIGTGRGDSNVRVEALERSLLPSGFALAPIAISAIIVEELRINANGVLRRADRWQPVYRWAEKRPHVGLAFALPSPGRIPGVIRGQVFAEEQTYLRPDSPDTEVVQARRRVGGSLEDWATHWLRWRGGAFVDRFDATTFIATEGELGLRLLHDHVAVTIAGARWRAAQAGTRPFATAELRGAWRSTTTDDRRRLIVSGGVIHASAAAPLAVWPGASSGFGRGVVLRAHRLLVDDVVVGEVFGRRIAFANVEHETPVMKRDFGALGVAGFLDLARAWHNGEDPDTSTSRLHADVGAGLRVRTRGSEGAFRLDLGVGLRDGRVRISAGYTTTWGR